MATHLGTPPGDFASVNELARITPAGAIMGVPLTNLPASKTFLVDGSLTFGPDGNLWTNLDEQASSGAITAHDIAHITPAGAVTLYTLPSAGAAPVGYVVGADGNLWFIEYPANAQLPAKIARITPAGQLTEYALPTEAGGLFPSLTRNGDSTWFVDEQASCSGNTCQIVHSQIGRITMSGTITTYPVPSSSQAYYLNNGPDGNLYFVEMTRTTSQPAVGNDRLGRITPSGQIVEYTVPMYHVGRFNLLAGSGNTLWLTGTPAQGQTGASFITRITLPHG